jgi:hypothetical protein
MAHCGGICGIELDCPDGCGVFCPSDDCVDCTQWCEPTTVENTSGFLKEGVMIRVDRSTENLQISVETPDKISDSGLPKYPDTQELSISFHDLPRSSIARLLSHGLGRSVRAVTERQDERISGTDKGTLVELAAKYYLVVE